ncbi:MAG: hypothetical protein ABIQ95_16810 [Bdellovibrionia bacterium]
MNKSFTSDLESSIKFGYAVVEVNNNVRTLGMRHECYKRIFKGASYWAAILYYLAAGFAAAVEPLTTFIVQNPTVDPTEVTVSFKYSVVCSQEAVGDEVRGYILYQGRRTIVDFYIYRNELEVALGSGSVQPEEAVLELEFTKHCRLDNLQAQVEYENVKITGKESSRELIEKLALIHSPFINLRENQYEYFPNDTPLLLSYSVYQGEGSWVEGKFEHNKVLRYTVFLSDEDNQLDSSDANAQMARYGRTADIEWVYDVELDSDHKVVRESYQGILHFSFGFGGGYLPSERTPSHPLLYNYNMENNNVFVDTAEAWFDPFYNPKQKRQLVGHHLVPRIRIDNPQARERVMFANPWTYKVSEAELRKQGKAAISTKDQLFILVLGDIMGGSFLGEITSTQGEVFLSGGNPCNSWRCNVSELGTDLWGRESLTAVPIGEFNLNLMGTSGFSGEFRLRDSIFLDLQLKRLRFFRLRDLGQTFGLEELSSKFKCDYRDAQTLCRF